MIPHDINSTNAESHKQSWLSSYEELSELMYEVLRSCPSLTLLGTSVVHFRHPITRRQFHLCNSLHVSTEPQHVHGTLKGYLQRIGVLADLRLLRAWLGCLRSALHYSVANIQLQFRFRSLLKQQCSEPADMVLRTTCTDLSRLGSSDDFFYGKLPTALQERGIQCVMLCTDYRGGISGNRESEFAQAILTRQSIRSVPERLLVPVWAPVVTAFKQLATGWTLRRRARKAEEPRLAKAYMAASTECLASETTLRVLTFYSVRKAVTTWKARVMTTQYEGSGEEKLAWHGAKSADQNCTTAGYQLGTLMRHSLSLTAPNLGSWEFVAPDVVLCLGQSTMKMLQHRHQTQKTKFLVFGSYTRALSRSLLRPPKLHVRTILVVPEGSAYEASQLFNFAMKVAALRPDYRFILRCHPARSFSEYRAQLDAPPEEFANVEISQMKTLNDDCLRSSVLLYRGSSSVLVGSLLGLKPVYLRIEGTPEVDPLFELTCWREHVSSPHKMVEVLKSFEDQNNKECMDEWRIATDYVTQYAYPADDVSVDSFLEAVELKGRITQMACS